MESKAITDHIKNIRNIRNIRKTILEMFIQRKYKKIDCKKIDLIPSSIGHIIITAEDTSGNPVWAFDIISKLNADTIQAHLAVMNTHNIKHSIMICEKQPTPVCNNVIANSLNLGIIIELFQTEDLEYNPTKHILQPKFSLLDEKEAEELKKKYGASNFPVLLRSDPIVRFYNYDKGSIIKITRKNVRNGISTGESITYRIVK